MKSLKQQINESLDVLESKVAIYTPDSDSDDELEYAFDNIDSWADKIEDIKPNQLKLIFKDADAITLKDYCAVLAEMAAWLRGITNLGRDDSDSSYVGMAQDIAGSCIDNVGDNLIDEKALKTANNDDAVYKMVELVASKWDEIIKKVFHVSWSD